MAINITAPTKTKDGYISNWFACNNPVVFAFETTSSDNFIQIALYETDGISQIVELKRVPFPNNNIIKFDFQSFLQSVTSNEDDSLLINTGVGVNAVSQYKTFRIGYRTTETGAYTVDINEYNAINSVRQALSPYGQNMVDYLYNIDYSGPTLDFSGRFLTEFKELPLYWFSPFDNPSASEVTYFYPTLAFIITEEFADNSTGYKVVSDFKNSDGSIAKTITQNNVFSSPYSQRVVYINYESVSPDEAFFYDSIDITIQDLDNNFDISVINYFIHLSTKEDISPLIKKLEGLLDNNSHSDEMTLISKRQVDAVSQTLFHIEESRQPIQTGELEFFAHHINEAIENISNITRPYEHTQMLDVMFGEFCLGK